MEIDNYMHVIHQLVRIAIAIGATDTDDVYSICRIFSIIGLYYRGNVESDEDGMDSLSTHSSMPGYVYMKIYIPC